MNDFISHIATQLELAGLALLASTVVGTFIGALAYELPSIGRPTLACIAMLRVIPSLAVLMFLLPWLGIGMRPAISALALLACAPIAIAVESALHGVPGDLHRAAHAMGADAGQFRRLVLWPLAAPSALGGLRTAAVETIAGATLAAFVGGGGLGDYILEGLATEDVTVLLKGAVSIAALAWITEFALAAVQRRLEFPNT
jgi:osmoprotectant transport system permease protein